MTTPLVSGLFYLAPGTGFVIGSIVGGNLSDCTVKKYIRRRNGVRLAQDRLNSALVLMFGITSASALIYGWALEMEVGGLAVPILSAFCGGFGLMGCFSGLNTYAAGMFIFIFEFKV
mgnify:CR=1 FL=1